MNGRTGGTVHAHVAGGNGAEPQRLVLSPHRDAAEAAESGEWIAAVGTVPIER